MKSATADVVSLDVPEDQVNALTTDIATQLGALPTVIVDINTYRLAKESLPLLKRAEDRVKTLWGDVKAAAFNAHRLITAKETEQLAPIKVARQRISTLIYDFEREQDRIRREQERALADARRQEQETEALTAAQQLKDQGAPEMADQVIEQAISAPAPVVSVPSAAVAVAGVSSRENWQYVYSGASPGHKWKDLTDEQRKHALQLLPREYLMPDESAIGRVVKAMKSGTKIPGVQAYDAGTVAVRG